MEWAGALKRVVVEAWHRDVAHLGVHESVQQRAARHAAATDARAHGDVDEVLQPARRSVAALAERGTVHVGVEADGAAREGSTQGREQVALRPAGLGRRGDAPVVRRAHIELERAEGGDSQRRERMVATFLIREPRAHLREQALGIVTGGKLLAREQALAGISGDAAHELGAAGLDRAEERSRVPPSEFRAHRAQSLAPCSLSTIAARPLPRSAVGWYPRGPDSTSIRSTP